MKETYPLLLIGFILIPILYLVVLLPMAINYNINPYIVPIMMVISSIIYYKFAVSYINKS